MIHPKGTCILVSGVTGKQGGAVASHLLKAGFWVRGLTRSAASPRAKALAQSGVEIVEGDLDKPETLSRALQGAYGVFSVQNYYEKGVGFAGEVRQGKNLAEASSAAGVRHFVQSTMATAIHAERVEHFQSKFAIERIVDDHSLPRTFVGTVWFMDNLFDSQMGGVWNIPAIEGTLGRRRSFEMMAVDDLGGVVTEILLSPEKFMQKKVDVAGDRLSVSMMRSIFAEVMGRRTPPFPFPNVLLRLFNRDFAHQLLWQRDVGWSFSLDDARTLYPGMQNLQQFLHAKKTSLVGKSEQL